MQLRSTSAYAGFSRNLLINGGGTAGVQHIEWTRAHRTAKVIAGLSGMEAAIAKANFKADEFAKLALDEHPQQPDEVTAMVDEQVRFSNITLQLTLRIMPQFSQPSFAKAVADDAADDAAAHEVPVATSPAPPPPLRQQIFCMDSVICA